jgi:hypothetical protein
MQHMQKMKRRHPLVLSLHRSYMHAVLVVCIAHACMHAPNSVDHTYLTLTCPCTVLQANGSGADGGREARDVMAAA